MSFTRFNHLTTPRKLREEIQQTLGPLCQVYGERNQKIRSSSLRPPKALDFGTIERKP